MRTALVWTLVVACAAVLAAAARDNKECEVCRKVLDDFLVKYPKAKDLSIVEIEDKLEKYCDDITKKKPDSKERKFCYYMTAVRREVSQPMKNGVPTDRICKRMKKSSADVCTLTFDEEVDYSKVDLNTLRVTKLKTLLMEEFGDDCKGCVEKSDYIARINALRSSKSGKADL